MTACSHRPVRFPILGFDRAAQFPQPSSGSQVLHLQVSFQYPTSPPNPLGRSNGCLREVASSQPADSSSGRLFQDGCAETKQTWGVDTLVGHYCRALSYGPLVPLCEPFDVKDATRGCLIRPQRPIRLSVSFLLILVPKRIVPRVKRLLLRLSWIRKMTTQHHFGRPQHTQRKRKNQRSLVDRRQWLESCC